MESQEPETDKEILARATAALVSRVGALADAMQVNNHKIDELSAELNKKPDDSEVQFIAGLARSERTKHFKYAIVTAVLSAVLSGMVSYQLSHQAAERQIRDRNQVGYSGCVSTNERVHIIAESFRDVVKNSPVTPVVTSIRNSANKIDSTARKCEVLYPKDKR